MKEKTFLKRKFIFYFDKFATEIKKKSTILEFV